MTTRRIEVRADEYVDSVKLMSVSRAMQDVAGIEWASAVMGTATNMDLLRESGFDELPDVGASDLLLAVMADSEDAASSAIQAALDSIQHTGDDGGTRDIARHVPKTVSAATAQLEGANVAVVSVPGAYAALEAFRALEQGLHVLLFSDNVPLDDEITLKRVALERGLLVMGPGAGTAMLGGAALGFANVVRQGPVRVVAAAGTGAQEVMTLLHRWGTGVSHVIGVGGRDVTENLGGVMMQAAIRARSSREERALLLVSKPPDPEVAQTILTELEGRTAVCAFMGLREQLQPPTGVTVTRTLEDAALRILDLLGMAVPNVTEGLADQVRKATADLPSERRSVRGVFSGGSMCYESMVVLSDYLGPIHSNTPLQPDWGLPAPRGAHVCLDLGEEEYTRGHPHPMIDPLARADELRTAADDETTGVVLLDVVLGYGAHDDPAGELAPVLSEITGRSEGPLVVTYLLGTEDDPQGADRQTQVLRRAGCLIAPTATRAALMAAAIVARDPELTQAHP